VAKNHRKIILVSFCFCAIVLCVGMFGCESPGGYSSAQLYQEGITSVYVEMFDNQSFRRGIEYELTDALAKRIEAQTPYKVVSNPDKADTVIGGQILQAGVAVLSIERQTGRAIERQVRLRAVVSWKNLKTGQFIIDNKTVTAAATYSQWQSQSFEYASALAANTMAEKIVELMEKPW